MRRLFLHVALAFACCALCAEELEATVESDTSIKKPVRDTVLFVKDLLEDKKPLRLDFGAEPNSHGSKLFVGVQYDWNDLLGSRLRFEYDNSATMSSSGDDVVNEDMRTYSIFAYPFVLYFGDAERKARTAFFRVDFGAYYSYQRANSAAGSFFTQETDGETVSGYLIQRQQHDYQLLGSAFAYSLHVPLLKYLAASFEGYLYPL